MAVARQEVRLRKLPEIPPDARPHGVDARHESGALFGGEYAHLHEGLQKLNRYKTGPRETCEGQSSVSLAVLNQPVNTADLVDLRVADGRKPLGQQIDLRTVAPPQCGFAMHDSIRQAS